MLLRGLVLVRNDNDDDYENIAFERQVHRIRDCSTRPSCYFGKFHLPSFTSKITKQHGASRAAWPERCATARTNRSEVSPHSQLSRLASPFFYSSTCILQRFVFVAHRSTFRLCIHSQRLRRYILTLSSQRERSFIIATVPWPREELLVVSSSP